MTVETLPGAPGALTFPLGTSSRDLAYLCTGTWAIVVSGALLMSERATPIPFANAPMDISVSVSVRSLRRGINVTI